MISIDTIDPMSATDRLVLADYLAEHGQDLAAERQRFIGIAIRDGFTLPHWFWSVFADALTSGVPDECPNRATVNMHVMLSYPRTKVGQRVHYAMYHLHGCGFDPPGGESLRHLYPINKKTADTVFHLPQDGLVVRWYNVISEPPTVWPYRSAYELIIHPEAAANLEFGVP